MLVLSAAQYGMDHVSRRFDLFFFVVVSGTDMGNYLLPVFKEQSEVSIPFILRPVFAVYLDLHPTKCHRRRLPGCA